MRWTDAVTSDAITHPDAGGPAAILVAAADLPEITVDDGAAFITEGEHQDHLLVLVSGQVEVSRENVLVATISTPGAIFGELAALLHAPATATARARGTCTLRISDDPQSFLRSRPEVALAIAEVLARRVDALTRYLVDVREQYADRADHLGVVDVVLESLSHHQGTKPDPGSDRELEAPY
jgi:CRP/FNR family cyclic AMP-dependent transcriptional regulator